VLLQSSIKREREQLPFENIIDADKKSVVVVDDVGYIINHAKATRATHKCSAVDW